MSDETSPLAEKKERWEIRLIRADVYYKIIILIIGGIIAACFVGVQYQQTQSRYYADLMSQRESADSNLRVAMFKELFEAYFKSEIQKLESEKESEILARLHHETILADLLARNFENIDVRPLFEDLDQRLADKINGSNDKPAKDSLQAKAFKYRQELRRIASSAIGRQVAALEGIPDESQKAHVYYHRINTCENDNLPKQLGIAEYPVHPSLPTSVQDAIGPTKVVHLGDGTLELRILKVGPEKNEELKPENELKPSGDASSINLLVTFFGMPVLDSIRLNTNERVAFSIYRYLSQRDCMIFYDYLDKDLQQDCPLKKPKDQLKTQIVRYDPKDQQPEDCAMVQFQTVTLPKDFLGVHDRPYISELAAGQYRNPWWKFW